MCRQEEMWGMQRGDKVEGGESFCCFHLLAQGGLGARLRGYRWTLEGLLLKAKIRRRWWSVCSFKAGRVERCCLDLLWLY